MKTLIISLEYPPTIGGIASYVHSMSAHLSPAEIVVYAPRVAGDKEFDKQFPWPVYRRRPYWLIWPRWLRLLFQVWRIITKESVKLIHIHHVLPVGYVGYVIKKIFRIPYVLFLHGSDLALISVHQRKLKKCALICRAASQIIVNSQFLQNKLIGLIDNIPAVTVLNPCPADIFFQPIDDKRLNHLRSQFALDGKKVIITVARFVDGKGYPHLARILPLVAREIPNIAWLIIGDGPKRPAVLKQIQSSNLQNIVRFFGVIPFMELPLYYHLAQVFVALTHADEGKEEGWGTVFLEAAASGLPVVAGRVGGVEEAVENLKTGIIVDIHQEKAVVSSIVELLKNPDYARAMGQAGRDRALREFTWEKQIKKLETGLSSRRAMN